MKYSSPRNIQLVRLSTEDAQDYFHQLPADQQLVSLSPQFAAADAHRAAEIRCVHLAVTGQNHNWIDSIHIKPLRDGGWGAISPYGYGGAVSSSRDPAWIDATYAAYSEWCARHEVVAEFRRFHPCSSGPILFKGAKTFNRQTVSVDVGATSTGASYNSLARRKIRRCISAGVTSHWTCDAGQWERFSGFYREAMELLHAAPGYLFPEAYFQALQNVAGAKLCICSRDGKWLSAGVYLFGPEVVEYHLGANSPDGQEVGSPFLMQHAAIRRATDEGAHSLYLGGGTDPDDKNPLLFYKKCFSKNMLPFFTGQAVHDDERYWELAGRAGYDRINSPPERILLD